MRAIKRKINAKAIMLMSGGLDSILALKILQEQGIRATPICFESYFFSCAKAKKAAQEAGFELRIENISKGHLKIVKHPSYGYGAAVNPCIDCHLLMLKTAKEIMEAENFDFVATGEVLGQRPMSQNKQSLDSIEREAGLSNKLLRPLSAKLLTETEIEKKGLVDRSKLYSISGRSRKPQLELANQFGIKSIPQAGGGCILTDSDYGRKLKELMARQPDFSGRDAQILRYGRPFWEGDILFIVARDKNECEKLNELAQSGDWLIEPQNFPGPTVLVRAFGQAAPQETIEPLAKKYVLRYSKKIPPTPEISITRL
jgi:predicted subunit of tRNA(5-methylaminomethyl-2-thiouridylate) methyltransferase